MKREFMRLHLALGMRKIVSVGHFVRAWPVGLNPALDLGHRTTS